MFYLAPNALSERGKTDCRRTNRSEREVISSGSGDGLGNGVVEAFSAPRHNPDAHPVPAKLLRGSANLSCQFGAAEITRALS